MHSSRVPIIHKFGIVSKKIADSLVEEFEEREEPYRIPSPSPVMPSSPRIKTLSTPDVIIQTPTHMRERQYKSISSKFIQDYNKAIEEIEKSPSKHKLHQKLEETLQLTERKLNISQKSNYNPDPIQIGELWKDILFMYQCQGPLQIQSLVTLLNSLVSTPLLTSPQFLFTVLHMVPLELKDLLTPIDLGTNSQIGSPNNYIQSNTLLKAIYHSQILQTGYSRLYMHYLLGRLDNYKNFALVIQVLQSSLTADLLTLAKSSPFVWMCIKHAMSVLQYLSVNIDFQGEGILENSNIKPGSQIFTLDFPIAPSVNTKSSRNGMKSNTTLESFDLFEQFSPEIFHTLDIWHEVAFCHSQNLGKSILQFLKCYISNPQPQTIMDFSIMIDILALLSLNDGQIAEILILLPIFYSYASNINATFETTKETNNWSSLSEAIDEITCFYKKTYQNSFTFQWDCEHTTYYIHSITKVCLQTKISYIRKLFLIGKLSNSKLSNHIKLGLIDLSRYKHDENPDFSTNVRYLAVKGMKDVLASFTTQVSTEKCSLAPLGVREITLQMCKSCLESESCQSIIFLLNHYRPCTRILLTSSKEYFQSTLMLIHNNSTKQSSSSVLSLSKSMTSSISNMSKSSPKPLEKKFLTFNSLPKTPTKDLKAKVQLNAIRSHPHSDTSSIRNELKMRNISFRSWQKTCDESTNND